VSERIEIWNQAAARIQSTRIAVSYQHWTGQRLLDCSIDDPGLVRALFFAPFALLSHGTETDPILNYGNQWALDLWEADWDQLTRMPSRLTAEPALREERARLLAAIRETGYATGYSGTRISRTGRRFRIAGAEVWTVLDESGNPAGQAARFARWQHLITA
jgi:hypothetical protein